jgi:GlpG protein
MRQVATFDDERSARLFADILCAREIPTDISRSRVGEWGVWVHEEKHVEASRAAYAAFDAHPDAPEHLAAEGCVERKNKAQVVVERKSRHEVIDVRRRFPAGTIPFGRVTLFLVVLSVLCSIAVAAQSYASVFATIVNEAVIGFPMEEPFERILHGEVWRLVTPIFLHFGVLHILFNMWWLLDIGSAVELRHGPIRYAAFILITAVISNAAQYAKTGMPFFGGMSGVLYALFAYVWFRGRLDPNFGMTMPNGTAVALLVWLALGFTGLIGNVANITHLSGLAAGAVIAALGSVRARA